MTLLPAIGVRGHPGKRYDVNEICAAPGCGNLSAHAHHLWSRSYLRGQPYEWVELADGTVLGNRVGLCFGDHEKVTGEIGGYRARIVLASGLFWWETKEINDSWIRTGPLDFQPPGVSTLQPQNGRAQTEAEQCPTCGHRKTARALPKRKTKTWTLTVPDDAEHGSDVLDGWVDDIAEILGMEDTTSRLRRYHAINIALVWVMQNRAEFVRDIQVASERLRAE